MNCFECGSKLYEYQDGCWLDYICWRCGHYESNTPAFKSAPYLFKDLVRNDPEYFMRKYCSPPKTNHPFSTPDDETEPKFTNYSDFPLFFYH